MSDTQRKLTILQYNVNHSAHKIQIPFLQQLDPRVHHVVAIQEPWVSLSNKNTVTHPGYHTILPDAAYPRTAIYISKEINTQAWSAKEYSGDLITVRLDIGDRWINILNCYNPSGPTGNHTLGTLPLIERATQEKEGEEILLLGDFNLHHPRWGGNNTLNQH